MTTLNKNYSQQFVFSLLLVAKNSSNVDLFKLQNMAQFLLSCCWEEIMKKKKSKKENKKKKFVFSH